MMTNILTDIVILSFTLLYMIIFHEFGHMFVLMLYKIRFRCTIENYKFKIIFHESDPEKLILIYVTGIYGGLFGLSFYYLNLLSSNIYIPLLIILYFIGCTHDMKKISENF